MKKIVLILAAIVMLAGCAAAPKCPVCPADDVVFMTQAGPTAVPKGFFSPETEGESWMSLEAYQKMMEQRGGM